MSRLDRRRKTCNRLGDRYYPPDTRREHTLRAVIGDRLPARGVFLDAGCGPWLGLARMFAPRSALAVGMDVEDLKPEMLEKGCRGVRGDLMALPFANRSVDLITMRSVLEHLSDPVAAFAEVARVLAPGGWIVAMTPSRWYYASVIGRLMPDAAGRRLLEFIYGPRVHDNFPVYYRANTPGAMRRVARAAGLDLAEAIPCPHPPDYLKFSPLLFRLGVLYDRLAGLTPATRVLQASYIYVLRKP